MRIDGIQKEVDVTVETKRNVQNGEAKIFNKRNDEQKDDLPGPLL